MNQSNPLTHLNLYTVEEYDAQDAQGKPVGEERFLTELKQRFRDTRVGPDGLVFLLTDETNGALLRIEPAK